MTASLVLLATALGLCGVAALLVARLLRGPTPFDRLLATHGLWSCAALVAAALAVLLAAPALLDAALAFVLAEAALAIAAIKALRTASFQPAMAPLDESATP
jgi:multisubunit Na+/H+ antiporter MnhF subunit